MSLCVQVFEYDSYFIQILTHDYALNVFYKNKTICTYYRRLVNYREEEKESCIILPKIVKYFIWLFN